MWELIANAPQQQLHHMANRQPLICEADAQRRRARMHRRRRRDLLERTDGKSS
jgi:hypothetical protein